MASIKVDVIYYKTPSDFEFEFNLSGCAGIRIFKEKIETPKALVTSLARDVARSRIIIIVSDLNEDIGGISTLSRALGLPLVAADKEAYHIVNEGECNIFKGATPLVTKNGNFAGFIAESGPQSIVVLSTNRALRHEIMDSYVHKYIFEVAQVEAFNEKYKTQIATQSEPIYAGLPKEDDEEPEIVSIDLAPGTSISPLPAVQEDKIENDSEAFLNKRLPQKNNGLNIALLVIVVLLLIGFGVLAYLFIYIPLLNGETPFLSEGIKYFLRR